MTDSRVLSMTADELETIVRRAVREELNAAGLRIDEPEHQDAAREDFRFVRKMRTAFEGTASKVGAMVITALVSGIIWLIWMGVQAVSGKQ